MQLTIQDPENLLTEIFSQWEAGGSYTLSLKITQTSEAGQEPAATLEEVIDYGEAEKAEPEPAPMEPKEQKAMKMMGKEGQNLPPSVVSVIAGGRRK